MNKKQAAIVARKIVEQLFNHGWAEDYQTHLEYNDHFELQRLFEIAIDGDGKALNNAIDRGKWDDEADLKYDDGGLFSFALEIGKILRQHGALDEEKKEVKSAKNRTRTEHSFKCPHCGSHNSHDGTESEVECRSCENPVAVEV